MLRKELCLISCLPSEDLSLSKGPDLSAFPKAKRFRAGKLAQTEGLGSRYQY